MSKDRTTADLNIADTRIARSPSDLPAAVRMLAVADRVGDSEIIQALDFEIRSVAEMAMPEAIASEVRSLLRLLDDARGPGGPWYGDPLGGGSLNYQRAPHRSGTMADRLELRADRLAGLLGLADGREAESFVPDGDDMNILQALADASPQSLTNEEIARRLPKHARVGETKLRDRLKLMREAGCAGRPPKSPNKMHVITDVGQAILDRRSPRVDHG